MFEITLKRYHEGGANLGQLSELHLYKIWVELIGCRSEGNMM